MHTHVCTHTHIHTHTHTHAHTHKHTCRIHKVTCGKRVPVLLGLQTWAVKVLANDVHVEMTENHKFPPFFNNHTTVFLCYMLCMYACSTSQYNLKWQEFVWHFLHHHYKVLPHTWYSMVAKPELQFFICSATKIEKQQKCVIFTCMYEQVCIVSESERERERESVCVCVCVRACTCACVHACVCACMHVYKFTCIMLKIL